MIYIYHQKLEIHWINKNEITILSMKNIWDVNQQIRVFFTQLDHVPKIHCFKVRSDTLVVNSFLPGCPKLAHQKKKQHIPP